MDLSPFIAMVYRQVKRWWSARSRVITTIINPLIWIIFLGLGWGAVFQPGSINSPSIPGVPVNVIAKTIEEYFNRLFGGIDYITFMVSGMAAMTVFMTSFLGGISVIWDKQFGYLKETLVAPAPRWLVITGRIVGDSIVNTIQSLIIILLGFAITTRINPIGVPVALVYLFITSIAFSSLGVIIALKLGSIEGFQMIVNLLTMPLMFMSGVFYPVNTMPDWMKIFAQYNPLSYAVHSVRYWLTGADVGLDYMNPLTDTTILTGAAIILLAIAGWAFNKATIEE
ncbi:MAG: ABC transporter permease [Desulfurococcaceae archaeon]|jgi:ABC-2 type transport system permease protein|nr:ABC transporter permease [Desulfurococcaceae archaeon]